MQVSRGANPPPPFQRKHDDDWDRAGCFWSLLRFSFGSLILWVIMAFLVAAVGLLSLLLFR